LLRAILLHMGDVIKISQSAYYYVYVVCLWDFKQKFETLDFS